MEARARLAQPVRRPRKRSLRKPLLRLKRLTRQRLLLLPREIHGRETACAPPACWRLLLTILRAFLAGLLLQRQYLHCWSCEQGFSGFALERRVK